MHDAAFVLGRLHSKYLPNLNHLKYLQVFFLQFFQQFAFFFHRKCIIFNALRSLEIKKLVRSVN